MRTVNETIKKRSLPHQNEGENETRCTTSIYRSLAGDSLPEYVPLADTPALLRALPAQPTRADVLSVRGSEDVFTSARTAALHRTAAL